VISAVLQAVAAWLTARGKVHAYESKAAKSLGELVDTAAQVLLYSSAAARRCRSPWTTSAPAAVAGSTWRLQGLRRVLPAGPCVRGRLDGGRSRTGCVQVPEGRAGLDMFQG